MVIENVAALAKKGLDIVLQTLSKIGYNAEWNYIRASEFGAPHRRERIWIVAYPKCIGRKQESIIFGKSFNEKIQYASQWKLSRAICKETGKKALPESFGIYDGIPRQLYDAERITALGNSVVPIIPIVIFQEIEQYLITCKNK